MSVKLGNATVDQMAKALKKAVKKSPEALKALAEENPGFFKKNGNLSSKRIAAGFLAEYGDCFTRSRKLNDKGRIELAKDGCKLNQSVKKAFKKIVDEFQSSKKAEESLQNAIQSKKDTIASQSETIKTFTDELAKKIADIVQSSGKKL